MFAFRTGMKVADQPGAVANPLYIFGDVGLRKNTFNASNRVIIS